MNDNQIIEISNFESVVVSIIKHEKNKPAKIKIRVRVMRWVCWVWVWRLWLGVLWRPVGTGGHLGRRSTRAKEAAAPIDCRHLAIFKGSEIGRALIEIQNLVAYICRKANK